MFGSLLLVLGGALWAGAGRFSFTTIDVPNALSTTLGGVDKDGKLVGSYFDNKGIEHGFLRLPDGTLICANNCAVNASIDCPANFINACSTSVGTSLHRIDSLGENVAGSWTDSAGVQHGLVIELSASNTVASAVSFDYPTPGVTATFVNGININGEISGGYMDSDGIEHGFIASLSCLSLSGCFQRINFTGAVMTELGNVNDRGDVVGWYLAADSKIIGFLLSGGNFTILSSPSRPAVFARGINNHQQIVGFDSNAFPVFQANPAGVSNGLSKTPFNSHGFLTTPTGQATSVNFPGPGAQGTGVGSINDSGTIAGQYNSPGSATHGFIAVPAN